MKRKNIICIVLTAVMLLSAGCNRSTVDDAVAIDANQSENITKTIGESTTTRTEISTEKSWVSGRKANILEAKMNEKISYGGYELTVLDVWIASGTLAPLDEMTGSTQFREYLVKKNSDTYDETGKYYDNSKDVKNLFVKIKIKNLAYNEWNDNTLCMNLPLFCKNGNSYNRIIKAEADGYDKYTNIKNIKDSLKLKFEVGEEVETVVAITCFGDVSANNLYLYSGFLNPRLGDGINDIGDGSYMIKLDCVEK